MIHLTTKKYAHQSFKSIYGLNKQTIKKILGILGFKQQTSGVRLEQKNITNKLNELFLNLRTEFKLRLITFSRIILLIYTKSYRGMRHLQGLPLRGQRTHANGKTPKALKTLGKNLPFRFKRKTNLENIDKTKKKTTKLTKKKTTKLSKKQKGKLKAKQKHIKKKK